MGNNKIGGLTCCWNEEVTIVQCVGSLLNHVDVYVLVDTGSDDKTIKLVENVFEEELESGKLIFLKEPFREDFDISIPKNKALEELRSQDCTYAIRLDADDVFYDAGAMKSVEYARGLHPSQIDIVTINHEELYSTEFETSKDFIKYFNEVDEGSDNIKFWAMRIPPFPRAHAHRNSYGHARIYNLDGAVSQGKWTDESDGLVGEDIRHPNNNRGSTSLTYDSLIVHYGWARPLTKKRAKGKIWGEEDDPRIEGLENLPDWHLVDDSTRNVNRFEYAEKYWPNKILAPFTNHPKAVYKYAEQLSNYFL